MNGPISQSANRWPNGPTGDSFLLCRRTASRKSLIHPSIVSRRRDAGKIDVGHCCFIRRSRDTTLQVNSAVGYIRHFIQINHPAAVSHSKIVCFITEAARLKRTLKKNLKRRRRWRKWEKQIRRQNRRIQKSKNRVVTSALCLPRSLQHTLIHHHHGQHVSACSVCLRPGNPVLECKSWGTGTKETTIKDE